MKSRNMLTILVLALGLIIFPAKVSEATSMGTAFTYQGRLIDANSAANGLYDFQFKLFDDPCTGSLIAGPVNEPNLDVIDGYFTAALDFGANVFAGDARWLEIGVRPGDPCEYTILSPRQEVTPTPYAIYAETAGDDNDWMISVNDMYSIPSGNVGIGTASPWQKFHIADSGMTSLFVHNTLDNVLGQLQADSSSVSVQSIYNHPLRFSINDIGRLYIDTTGNVGIGTTSPGEKLHVVGNLKLADSGGNDAVVIKADGMGSAGQISMYDTDGDETVRLVAAEISTQGAGLTLKDGYGTTTIELDADFAGTGGYIALSKADGTQVITLDADYNGDGRIITQELQITGGSDLSEQFDIEGAKDVVKPGMLVSIDPKRPGKLLISKAAYDNKVAGIISGAGGVKPGMMMGQKGSAADGVYPVALTGRVYCWADASTGAIQPGDLLTTSSVPGHAMKVSEHSRAWGAIIGKAMTPLEKGKGLVLVLVSLQ